MVCVEKGNPTLEGDETRGKEMEEEEEKERLLTEAFMAERYTIPAEVFSAGSGGDCVRVSSLLNFKVAVQKRSEAMFIKPYLPPRDAVSIQEEVEEKRLWLVLLNPEVLASKAAMVEAIDGEISNLSSLLLRGEYNGPDKVGSMPVSGRPEVEADEEDRISSILANLRRHQQNRLMIAFARQGNWVMTRKFLKLIYPRLYSIIPVEKTDDDGREALLEQIEDIAHMYPYSEDGHTEELSHDLIRILAKEDWEEQKKVARSRPSCTATGICESKLRDQIRVYEDLAKEPSLLGASESSLTNLLDSLKSFAISKGHLGDDFCGSNLLVNSAATIVLVESFCTSGRDKIDRLFELLDRTKVDFCDVKSTMALFSESVAS